MSKPLLRVSVFSDYICPFCYIGSRRLLRLEDEYRLEVNWCGLEIHPETPAAGMPVSQLGYGPSQWQALMHSLQRLAEAESLQLPERHFTTNSRQALLLAEAAKQAGRSAFYALHEALFDAFFGRGLNIGDRAVLQTLAQDAGLSPQLAAAAWRDPAYRQRLALNARHAAELDITATPTYVFGRRLLSGAVEEQSLRDAARELLASPTA